MMKFLPLMLLCLLGRVIAGEPPKRVDVVASATSPGHVLTVEVGLDEGRASWQVKRFGVPVIAPSRLGFLLRGDGKLERHLKVVAQRTSTSDTTWEQPWGESRFVRDHHVALHVEFEETLGAKRRFGVTFRVFDDGLGFRYDVPEQGNGKHWIIDDELTEFDLIPNATAWWIPAGEWNRYEYLYNRTPLAEVGQAHTPITVRTEDGLHVSFHEAALVDYSSMWLRRVEGQRLKAQLSPASEGWKVRRALPFKTPWRTVTIADTAGGLYQSNLILNLNEPNRLGDVSWFSPSKYVGVWWELHLERTSWARGPKHGATTANTKRYIDFAAANGFRGVLVEGWNLGWDGNWFGDGNDFDFTTPAEDFDLAGVARYAKERGVHLVGHHETGGAVSHYENQLDAALALYERLGIDSVKTGYVADAGQIERFDAPGDPVQREWHDGQWMSRHHLRVVEAAAKRHIAVNPHEPIKDTGLRRTYPNWVAREGARGMEYAAWGNPQNPPEHEVNLVFTRLLSGPMDYTPGIVSLMGRTHPIPSTLARQLALYVTIYSPIQMVADLPEHYAAQPEAFGFIKDVAVDWSETRVLNGEVGDFVTIARKDRNSEQWFLGALTDEHGRVFDVPLSFLDPTRTYRAEIYRDGDGAHFIDNRFAFATEQRDVDASMAMTLKLAAGGGQAIRFVPTATKR